MPIDMNFLEKINKFTKLSSYLYIKQAVSWKSHKISYINTTISYQNNNIHTINKSYMSIIKVTNYKTKT